MRLYAVYRCVHLLPCVYSAVTLCLSIVRDQASNITSSSASCQTGHATQKHTAAATMQTYSVTVALVQQIYQPTPELLTILHMQLMDSKWLQSFAKL